jgi:hypothetical protein
MNFLYFILRKQFLILSILLFMLGACSSIELPSVTRQDAAGSPTNDLPDLDADMKASLGSLEKIDNYPFYVMHYAGGYDYPQIESALPAGVNFACSLFTSLGDSDEMLYGRNFDWEYSPALLVYTEPPDGYASVSMVDLTFLGINPASYASLTELPLDERTMMLKAPSMPFDGMNEYGLTIAMAAVPDEYADDVSHDPSKPDISSIGIIRQVLDHARDVEEAQTIFRQYNIDFTGGPPIHYLVADPGGNAALIEFYRGEMVVLPNDEAWHLATNHMRCIASGDEGCRRYRIIDERLSRLEGQLDHTNAMQLLAEVKQDSTQWSTVYNMTEGTIHLVIGRNYKNIYTFTLESSQP